MRKFTSHSRVSFFLRRNRLAGLIKNYSLKNLALYLPGLVILYILFFVKELVLGRDFAMALSNVKAVLWNLWHLPYLVKERAKICTKIRKVSDAHILALMEKKSVVFAHLCGNL